MLKEAFCKALSHYNRDETVANTLWADIYQNHTAKTRQYHNITHLENLLLELLPCRDVIQDWDVIIFSICYHDIVYDVLINNNEELSAAYAKSKLEPANVPACKVGQCMLQIAATKLHNKTGDTDTDLFTDADTGILGKSRATYNEYAAQIRQEYLVYPDSLYNPGRQKVLQQFLNTAAIFKTDYFFNLYELQARDNIKQEIESLQLTFR
jgi:predicted metal-dependent HD superfamily phosphohydrolase